MKKNKNSIEKIHEIVVQEKQTTAKFLREKLNVSQVLVHRHLKKLCLEKKIKKIGSPPKVFYLPVTDKPRFQEKLNSSIVEDNFLQITPDGTFLYGVEGFIHWCNSRNFEPKDKKNEYENIFFNKNSFKKNGLINATAKVSQTFTDNFLEEIWYIDFYSWEIFGKTKLGQLVLYAKQNSDINLMQKIAKIVGNPLKNLISREKFQMVGIIPHSVPRKKDFLSTTLQYINLDASPEKIFEKVFQDHAVAQKTLKSKEERQQNALKTLFLKNIPVPSKVLLIDDACGSGATLNIAAKKIREKYPQTKVYGITFVGSLKGFDIIRET